MSNETRAEATTEPQRGRPTFHPDYGVATDHEGMLTWEWVTRRLADGFLYWQTTVNPDGKPLARPVWGVFVDGNLYVENGPNRTRRNLDRDPTISVHVANGDDVVIVEGTAETAFALPLDQATAIARAFGAKYGTKGYTPEPAQYQQADSGLFRIRPRVILAWSDFAKDPTRWRF
jgi:hypothetical protein